MLLNAAVDAGVSVANPPTSLEMTRDQLPAFLTGARNAPTAYVKDSNLAPFSEGYGP
jgi:hypothetical protein